VPAIDLQALAREAIYPGTVDLTQLPPVLKPKVIAANVSFVYWNGRYMGNRALPWPPPIIILSTPQRRK